MRGPAGTPIGKLRRILISNVMVYNADSHFASIISGIPGNDIEDVKLRDIRIFYRQIDSAATKIQQVVPEHEKTYPEPQKMGVMPAYGFFIRHVKNIELNNVEVSYLQSETRPAIVMDDVRGAEFFNVKAQKAGKAALIELRNVYDFNISGSKQLKSRQIKNIEKITIDNE